jgi:hypothetical protein
LTPGGPAAEIGARATKGTTVMSELDVIVIHIPCWAGRGIRAAVRRAGSRAGASRRTGAPSSAPGYSAAFGTDRRQDIAKYVIAVEVPSRAQHSQHGTDPGFQEFNRLADAFQPEDLPVYADRCCTLSDRYSASASAPGCHNADNLESCRIIPWG